MNDLSQKVTMLCPVCGNDQFESLDEQYPEINEASDSVLLKCSDCGATFSKEELIQGNSEKIEIAIEEMNEEAIKEIQKRLKKVWDKWKV